MRERGAARNACRVARDARGARGAWAAWASRGAVPGARASIAVQRDQITPDIPSPIQVVDALGRAVGILEKEMAKNPAALAQLDASAARGTVQALSAVLDAAALPSNDKQALQSLLQSQQQDDDDDAGAPAAATYKSHSSSILDVLEDLKEKAEGQLSELRKAETNSRQRPAARGAPKQRTTPDWRAGPPDARHVPPHRLVSMRRLQQRLRRVGGGPPRPKKTYAQHDCATWHALPHERKRPSAQPDMARARRTAHTRSHMRPAARACAGGRRDRQGSAPPRLQGRVWARPQRTATNSSAGTAEQRVAAWTSLQDVRHPSRHEAHLSLPAPRKHVRAGAPCANGWADWNQGLLGRRRRRRPPDAFRAMGCCSPSATAAGALSASTVRPLQALPTPHPALLGWQLGWPLD